LLAHPTVAAMLVASRTINEVRFIVGGLLPHSSLYRSFFFDSKFWSRGQPGRAFLAFALYKSTEDANSGNDVSSLYITD
jgi:hypothetical protein